MQNVPSSSSGEDERWGLLSSALGDSNRQIASGNNASERHCEDVGRSSLPAVGRSPDRFSRLKWGIASSQTSANAQFFPRNDGTL